MSDGHAFEAIVTLGDGAVECVPQPLVRCRDCAFYHEGLGYRDANTWCGEWSFRRVTKPDGYCWRGKRRDA